MSEIIFSKQVKPLIKKYVINPETNTLFQDVINLFSTTPNYQVWAVKLIFGKIIDLAELKRIKKWVDENKNLIKSLSKHNIISYSTDSDMDLLKKEISNLNAMAFVKKMISQFNTDQRHMLEEEINLKELNSLNAHTDKNFKDWYNILFKFNKLTSDRKNKFISLCSAYTNVNDMKEGLKKSTEESYMWNKKDFLSFIENNIKKSEIVLNQDNIVILKIKNFTESQKLCGGGRTGWCITREKKYFDQYVSDEYNRNQYFFFNFAKPETDEFAHIGFTVEKGKGIIYAHSTKNSNLMDDGIDYRGNRTNIFSVLKMFNIDLSLFNKIEQPNNYKWDIDDFVKKSKKLKNSKIIYNKNNRIIIKVESKEDFRFIVNHTFISSNAISFAIDSVLYAVLDFNLGYDNDNSIVALSYTKDEYGFEMLKKTLNVQSIKIDKVDFFNSIGLTDKDLNNTSDIDPSILLHKYIDEKDESNAIRVINENYDNIDINYEFNGRFPIFQAIYNGLNELFNVIIQHKNMSLDIEDGFGETLLTSLLYIYHGTDNSERENIGKIIESVINNSNIDINAQNINYDTAVNIASEFEEELWILKILLAKDNVNINVVNDRDRTALTNAINRNNIEGIKLLLQRSDVNVRGIDYSLADKNGINLKEMLKNNVQVKEEIVGKRNAKVVSAFDYILSK